MKTIHKMKVDPNEKHFKVMDAISCLQAQFYDQVVETKQKIIRKTCLLDSLMCHIEKIPLESMTTEESPNGSFKHATCSNNELVRVDEEIETIATDAKAVVVNVIKRKCQITVVANIELRVVSRKIQRRKDGQSTSINKKYHAIGWMFHSHSISYDEPDPTFEFACMKTTAYIALKYFMLLVLSNLNCLDTFCSF